MRYVILVGGSPPTLRFVTTGGEGVEKSQFQHYVIYGRPQRVDIDFIHREETLQILAIIEMPSASHTKLVLVFLLLHVIILRFSIHFQTYQHPCPEGGHIVPADEWK